MLRTIHSFAKMLYKVSTGKHLKQHYTHLLFITDESNEIKCLSICIISDHKEHIANTVHAFITEVMHYLKNKLPTINTIYYFSDGSSAQYKNYKNLGNLCFHQTDFGIKAEWHFFTTSYGKSPCKW